MLITTFQTDNENGGGADKKDEDTFIDWWLVEHASQASASRGFMGWSCIVLGCTQIMEHLLQLKINCHYAGGMIDILSLLSKMQS